MPLSSEYKKNIFNLGINPNLDGVQYQPDMAFGLQVDPSLNPPLAMNEDNSQQQSEELSQPMPQMLRANPGTEPPPDPRAEFEANLKQSFMDRAGRANDTLNRINLSPEMINEQANTAGFNTLLGGLSSSAAGMGNVNGKLMQTDAPQYFDAQNKNQQARVDNLTKLQQQAYGDQEAAMKGLNTMDEQPLNMQLLKQKVDSGQMDFNNMQKLNDPNSEESKTLRQLAGQVIGKPIPDNVPGSALERWKEPLGKILDNQTKIKVAQLEYGSKGQQAKTARQTQLETQYAEKFAAEPAVKAYKETAVAYNELKSLAESTSAPSDEAILVKFNKVLDPTSAVREGEFARTAEGQGLINNLQKKIQLAMGETKKGRLDPAYRQEIIDTSNQLMQGIKSYHDQTKKTYQDKAMRVGIDPEVVTGIDTPYDTFKSGGGGGSPFAEARAKRQSGVASK